MNKLALILIVLAILIVLFKSFPNTCVFKEMPKIFTVNSSENEEKGNYSELKISTEGFIPVNVSVEQIFIDKAQINLKAGCYLIEATTDACVADAIQKGIERKVDFRPTVYDVVLDAFRNLGIRVLAVKIVDMRENTFIGQLIVQQKEKVLALDIRPSDATAIALRAGAPIYINETLAKSVGKYIC